MKVDKVKLKPYPHPNPGVKGSRSRFAVRTTKDGDVLKAADPDYPISDFEYDPKTARGYFKPKKDKKGELLFEKGRPLTPYLPSQELVDLVELAQVLKRPVLIKGEPGSGKTQLARSVAYEWYGASYREHYFEWSIKSTSKAVDGLYTFDHVARLRDAQLAKSKGETPADADKKEDLTKYRKFGPMGKAFLVSTAEAPAILLIDEIDKADLDFANDLLLELDERRFTIPESETGEQIVAAYPPIIFITSNDERELPEAFLRRCLFLYIRFPDDDQLTKIIQAHLPGLYENNPAFIQNAIKRFVQLRDEIKSDPADSKRVSTSELLDWLTMYYFNMDDSEKDRSKVSLETLPFYHHALLKTYAAVNRREQANAKLQDTSKPKSSTNE